MRTSSSVPHQQWYLALKRRDPAYEGVFFAGVRITGVFCRPTCPARTPKSDNVEYFDTTRDAVLAGYRPCKRCRPLASGRSPTWLGPLLEEVETRPAVRWRDRDLRAMGLEPARIRGWFSRTHGLTFHAYARARGVGRAFAGEAFAALLGPPDEGADMVATLLPTPIGAVVVAADQRGIVLLEFADRPMVRTQIARLRHRIDTGFRLGRNRWILQLTRELAEYFDGERTKFEVPTFCPGSPFQEAVWNELQSIPYGETRSYRDIARAVGRPNAVRAVGKTNGDNRISILIPCHRVVGADGALRGYGGGLWRKERLLALESRGS